MDGLFSLRLSKLVWGRKNKEKQTKTKTENLQTKQLVRERPRPLTQKRSMLKWESSWDMKRWNLGHRADNWQKKEKHFYGNDRGRFFLDLRESYLHFGRPSINFYGHMKTYNAVWEKIFHISYCSTWKFCLLKICQKLTWLYTFKKANKMVILNAMQESKPECSGCHQHLVSSQSSQINLRLWDVHGNNRQMIWRSSWKHYCIRFCVCFTLF